MNPIVPLFENQRLDIGRLQKVEALPDTRGRYLIAITPRSGSSYLCNMIKSTKRLGWPQEFLAASTIEKRLPKNIPARSADEYLRNGIRIFQSRNKVSGVKTSWFQFQLYLGAMTDQKYLQGFKYIYLTRRDLAAQSVSLYKAVSSNVFHTVAQPSEEETAKLASLEYDYQKIKYWHDHIVAQEIGWQRYFYDRQIFPLCMSYEDIEKDVLQCIKRIAMYLKVKPENIVLPEEPSPYKKIRNQQSTEWALRFANELAFDERK